MHQYLPAHRPKMSEVVRMLEGDGLAEKWAAAQGHNTLNTISTSSKQPSSGVAMNPKYSGLRRESSSVLGFVL
ncbi:hypothetical protein Nepgr_019430 [Nepenthes gracilis]|uniref:Uncharacterized protein n=1 Tax=Nepenthes gracilis TaxID=150966 RepID=A0AAD3SV97_NEPGR|nr:hypothetical protein Nepgr_019430 [Nepenthes gracilis]